MLIEKREDEEEGHVKTVRIDTYLLERHAALFRSHRSQRRTPQASRIRGDERRSKTEGWGLVGWDITELGYQYTSSW